MEKTNPVQDKDSRSAVRLSLLNLMWEQEVPDVLRICLWHILRSKITINTDI